MKEIVIFPGVNKEKEKENFEQLSIKMGELVAIVGNTGSGKSRLIQDIEQMVQGESFTKRKIICNPIGKSENVLVAHLSQSMKFVLDISVGEFIALHLESRGKNISIASIIEIVNTITPEAINIKMNLNLLSGGQTRALMIVDIALICDAPIVLIDEIENAGIDKTKAFALLTGKNKIVLVVTHDVHTSLLADKRIIMKNGGICKIRDTTKPEKEKFIELDELYQTQLKNQGLLRTGEEII